MANLAEKAERVFKTAWFSKAARKAHIPDSELCAAIQQVMLGQCDDLVRFRAFAGLYARKTDADIAKELQLEELMEICHDQESQIQE
jgi:hypothetical protein